MKDKEKHFRERVECGIAYCEDTAVDEIKQDFKMQEEKHKQIEEIAKDIHRVCTACSGEMFDEYTCDRCQAKLLIEKGYRKLPEDSVVLSREEYIDLSRNYVGEQVAQARKETAKEFAEKLWNTIKDKGIDYKIGLRALGEEIDELLKEYEK